MIDPIKNATMYAFSFMPTQDVAVKSAKTMLLSAIALEALSNISGASAGPVLYASCIAACNAALAAGTLSPVGVGICFNACLPLWASPGL